MRGVFFFRRHLLVCLALLAAAGCGRDEAVSGKVVANGRPYLVADREAFGLSFEQTDGARQAFWATVRKDGTFRLARSLPVGKYRVCVTHRGDYAAFMQRLPGWGIGATGGAPDKFGGAFQGSRSPLTVELSGGSVRLTIDLGQRTVSKG